MKNKITIKQIKFQFGSPLYWQVHNQVLDHVYYTMIGFQIHSRVANQVVWRVRDQVDDQIKEKVQ